MSEFLYVIYHLLYTTIYEFMPLNSYYEFIDELMFINLSMPTLLCCSASVLHLRSARLGYNCRHVVPVPMHAVKFLNTCTFHFSLKISTLCFKASSGKGICCDFELAVTFHGQQLLCTF